jgi:predicted nucleic acid-binding protein
MILYLDASALVKVYALEQGTDDVLAWLDEAEVVTTAKVAYVEVLATMWRKRRAGELPEESFATNLRSFTELRTSGCARRLPPSNSRCWFPLLRSNP